MLLSMQWSLRVRGLRRGGVVPGAWTMLGAEGCVRSLVALQPASLARLPGRSARQGVRCWASARRVTLVALMGLIVGTDVRRRPASTREHLFEAVLRYRCLLPMSMMGWRCRGRWSGGQRPQEELAVRWEAAGQGGLRRVTLRVLPPTTAPATAYSPEVAHPTTRRRMNWQ